MYSSLIRRRLGHVSRAVTQHNGGASNFLGLAAHRRSVRPFSGGIQDASPPSLLKRVWRSLTQSDDYSDPFKVQERKDLYYLLLVTKLRDVRLQDPELEYLKAFDKAFVELQETGLDDMSNIQLRYEMQDLLGPQVVQVFKQFYAVDENLPREIFLEVNAETIAPFDDHDFDRYRDVLKDDYQATATKLEELKSSPDINSPDAISIKISRSISFCERKLGAMQSVLAYHGWLEGENGALVAGDWSNTFPTDFDDEMDDFGFRVTTADEETFIAMRRYQTINLYRAALLKNEMGYSILALKSLIPGAGRGVFVDGTALAGSLMAFQPGQVWPLGSVRPDVEAHFNDNDNIQLSIRYDNFIVDSRRAPYTVLTRKNSNPFSLGHVVNHPQPGNLPNCQSVMVNFVENMSLGPLQRYVPNTYAVPPNWINRTFDRYVIDMHSMCLLARRDVADEELFYDYRMLGDDIPRWYQKVQYPDDE